MSQSSKPGNPSFRIATSVKDAQDEYGIFFLHVSDYEWKLSKSRLSDPQSRNDGIRFREIGDAVVEFVNPAKNSSPSPCRLVSK
jgi:hypothetical protein